jgi:hypothetical protein
MGIGKWIKQKAAAVALSTARVEEDILSQSGQELDGGVGQVQRLNQGRLSDALKRGELTQEVKDLRWRMYKVLNESKGLTAKITGYDDDGLPIVEVVNSNKWAVENVKVDSEDDYEVIMVVDNTEITLSIKDTLDGGAVANADANEEEREDKDGDTTKTIGKIGINGHQSSTKNLNPISIKRELRPKFELEHYTKKMIVREIDDTTRLLELYISMYPDESDRKTNLLISDLRKAIINPRGCNSLDIQELSYVTNKTLGSKDFKLYEYLITGVHKIIEYNGHYVIKFKADVITNGDSIVEQFRETDLDNRYENKEAK